MGKSSTTGFHETSYELARCVVCGEADTREVAGPEDLREERELLWQFHMRRLSPRTPPDRLVDRVAFSQPALWRIVQCRICGLVYRNPVEKRDALREAYSTDELPDDAVFQALHRAQHDASRAQVRRLARHLTRRGTGLEVGSYVGAFLAAARESRWQFEGLDVNPRVNAFARSLGYTVHDGDLEHFEPNRTFDAVAIWNTFDQLPDPRTAARVALRLLSPDGVLAIRVPNGECYTHWRARIGGRGGRAARALLAHNNLLTFPYRYGFSPASLSRLLADVGFRVERVISDVLVPTTDEWTRPWARIESRVVKPLTKPWAPWFEIYARKIPTDLPTSWDANQLAAYSISASGGQ
jgi:SAM-dependent methyltransferase